MKKIDDITDLSFIGWHLQEQQLSSIDIEEQPFAVGGYGQLFNIYTPLLSALQGKWVVKIAKKEAGRPTIEGFRNIRELSQKIKDYQQQNYSDYNDFLIKYSPLIGFPQACFKGKFDVEEVYCYLMPDLYSQGFMLFSELLENIEYMETYIEGVRQPAELGRRIRTARLLAETFHLLQAQFKYLHGDVKAQSIWVKAGSHHCALIDYDGGLFDLNPLQRFFTPGLDIAQPQIFGQLQEWLAPEILQKVNEGSREARLQVSFESDNWSFAVGSFQILSGILPFASIEVLAYNSLEDYFRRFAWPETLDEDELFHPPVVLRVLEYIRSHLLNYFEIWKAWDITFNKGFIRKKERYDCGTWSKVFTSYVQQEPSVTVTASPLRVLEGDEATIAWEAKDATIKVDGLWKKSSAFLKQPWRILPKLLACNEFGEWPIEIPLEIVLRPVVSVCKLRRERVKYGTLATIEWDCRNAYQIEVIRETGSELVNNKPFEFVPKKGEKVEVVFYSKHNLAEERFSFYPVVIEPVQAKFFTSRRFTAETLPVILTWETANADQVVISSVQGTLELSGEHAVRPLKSTEYVLTARNEFFEDMKIVFIEVLPIPKIGNISLPHAPDLRIGRPPIGCIFANILGEQEAVKKKIKKIFDEKPL